jgi:hypothetical protein
MMFPPKARRSTTAAQRRGAMKVLVSCSSSAASTSSPAFRWRVRTQRSLETARRRPTRPLARTGLAGKLAGLERGGLVA